MGGADCLGKSEKDFVKHWPKKSERQRKPISADGVKTRGETSTGEAVQPGGTSEDRGRGVGLVSVHRDMEQVTTHASKLMYLELNTDKNC